MNGLEKITARITQDTDSEIAALLKEAEEKAAGIRAQYEAEARAEAEKAAETCKKTAVERLQRLESAAEMEAKKQILSAKQACIEDAFAAAQKKLCSLGEAEYVELLAKLAARSAKSGKEEVVLSPKDRKALGEKVVARANALLAQSGGKGEAKLTLSRETRPMEGGLTLKDGKVEINCAFETQLRMLRESMAAEVARLLFP